jgi:hypothetical protein
MGVDPLAILLRQWQQQYDGGSSGDDRTPPAKKTDDWKQKKIRKKQCKKGRDDDDPPKGPTMPVLHSSVALIPEAQMSHSTVLIDVPGDDDDGYSTDASATEADSANGQQGRLIFLSRAKGDCMSSRPSSDRGACLRLP